MGNDSKYYKYPKTPHLPWSEGLQNDDRRIESLDGFIGRQVVVTEKYDGENCSMYSDHIHARSLDSKHHPSRNFVKQLHGEICHNVPKHWRLCGENMFATHSIYYDKLVAYFCLFSIWNDQNFCLSWDETKEWASLLSVSLVPVLYEGIWDEEIIKACWTGVSRCGPSQEGYVIRIRDGFSYEDFSKYVAKFVRKGHVQTDEHWMKKPIHPNLIGKVS